MNKPLAKKEIAETLGIKAVQIHILATNFSDQLVCEVESNVELKVLFRKNLSVQQGSVMQENYQ